MFSLKELLCSGRILQPHFMEGDLKQSFFSALQCRCKPFRVLSLHTHLSECTLSPFRPKISGGIFFTGDRRCRLGRIREKQCNPCPYSDRGSRMWLDFAHALELDIAREFEVLQGHTNSFRYGRRILIQVTQFN